MACEEVYMAQIHMRTWILYATLQTMQTQSVDQINGEQLSVSYMALPDCLMTVQQS